jgi:hypothetical protein
MIVTDERVAQFLSRKVDKSFCPPYTVLGYERGGEIIVGALFNVFEKPDLHVSIAGNNFPMSFMKALGRYVFGQLCYDRATIITEQKHVVDLSVRVGGEVEGKLRNHFGIGRHGVIIGVLKEDYKYGYQANQLHR